MENLSEERVQILFGWLGVVTPFTDRGRAWRLLWTAAGLEGEPISIRQTQLRDELEATAHLARLAQLAERTSAAEFLATELLDRPSIEVMVEVLAAPTDPAFGLEAGSPSKRKTRAA